MFYATGLPGYMRGAGMVSQAVYTKEEEIQRLKNQAGHLQQTLEAINTRISELDSGDK
jgi:prefoldin subunit 5